jgi:CHAT domain-containing protein
LFDFNALSSLGPHWKSSRYLAFLLRAQQPNNVYMVDLGESDEIDALITQFRKDVTTAGPKYDLLPQTGSGLRKALFEPLKYFIGDSKRLFLAPDGDLFKLPFEVLPYNDTAHGNHLIDYYTITYITTASYILRFGNTLSDSHSEPVIIGDPDFDLRGNNTATNNYPNYSILPNRVYFYRLPGTRTEAEKIANMFGVKPWWLGASAIKEQSAVSFSQNAESSPPLPVFYDMYV